MSYIEELREEDTRIAELRDQLKEAKRELENFEMNQRVNTDLYSHLFEAKNDTQRKLTSEAYFYGTVKETYDEMRFRVEDLKVQLDNALDNQTTLRILVTL